MTVQKKYCLSPFILIHIYTNGQVHLCPCPGWSDTVIGNILTSSLDEMLSSPRAISIRQSIIDNTYQYCNEKVCAIMLNDGLNTIDSVPPNVKWMLEDATRYKMPYEIMLAVDQTCNLSCPSCRTEIIKVETDQQARQELIGTTIYNNIFSKPTDQKIHLVTNGAGEIFGSAMLLSLLSNIQLVNFPNLSLSLHTNGLLAEKAWHKIQHLHSAISDITVSIDAASADTYEKVRRGGKWKNINQSLKFLQNKKHELGFKLNARMIVQLSNYREAVDFYDMCMKYGIDRVEYSRLTSWRTWSPTEFKTHDVFCPDHPERSLALEKINQVRQLANTWFEGDFS